MDRSPDTVLDELLVLRAQDGDEQAFSVLVGRWQRRLLRHAIHLTDRTDGAADVVQESWLAIARGIGRLDDPACFPRWALQIVTRKAADWIRQRRRERTLLGRAAVNHRESPEPCERVPDERVDLLRDAVRRLPSDRRALLSMIYLDNLSVAAVAEVLGIPAGTVKSRLHHARQELKQLLDRSQP